MVAFRELLLPSAAMQSLVEDELGANAALERLEQGQLSRTLLLDGKRVQCLNARTQSRCLASWRRCHCARCVGSRPPVRMRSPGWKCDGWSGAGRCTGSRTAITSSCRNSM
jgi:hypothetical protein